MSIILPECTLSLPRLRFHGVKQFTRDARMHLDSASAPSVPNPYYAAALAQLQGAGQRRGAEPEEDGDKGAKKAAEPECTDKAQKAAIPSDLDDRLKRLEECFEKCVDQLKTLRAQQGQGSQGAQVVPTLPLPIPDNSTALETRPLHPLPPTNEEEAPQPAVSKANYEAQVGSQSSLRPLPPQRLPLP
jgi:hypothetical protein